MNTLSATVISLAILATPAACLANSVTAAQIATTMPVYDVIYMPNIDVVKKQTAHTLQNLQYQQTLEIRTQAKNNIAYIGARLHLNNQIAKQPEQSKQTNVAK